MTIPEKSICDAKKRRDNLRNEPGTERDEGQQSVKYCLVDDGGRQSHDAEFDKARLQEALD